MLKKRTMDSYVRESTILSKLTELNSKGFPELLFYGYDDDICIIVQ